MTQDQIRTLNHHARDIRALYEFQRERDALTPRHRFGWWYRRLRPAAAEAELNARATLRLQTTGAIESIFEQATRDGIDETLLRRRVFTLAVESGPAVQASEYFPDPAMPTGAVRLPTTA